MPHALKTSLSINNTGNSPKAKSPGPAKGHPQASQSEDRKEVNNIRSAALTFSCALFHELTDCIGILLLVYMSTSPTILNSMKSGALSLLFIAISFMLNAVMV